MITRCLVTFESVQQLFITCLLSAATVLCCHSASTLFTTNPWVTFEVHVTTTANVPSASYVTSACFVTNKAYVTAATKMKEPCRVGHLMGQVHEFLIVLTMRYSKNHQQSEPINLTKNTILNRTRNFISVFEWKKSSFNILAEEASVIMFYNHCMMHSTALLHSVVMHDDFFRFKPICQLGVTFKKGVTFGANIKRAW